MGHALDVMTFNIRHGRAMDGKNRWYRRRDLVFDVIRSRAPHLVGLQEVDPFQLDELQETFADYGVVARHRYGGIVGAYAPFLFDTRRLEAGPGGDFWLSSDPEGRRGRAWDAAVTRMCTWAVFRDTTSGRRFAAFNSHFDQRGVQARLHSAELVVQRLREVGHLPRLFTADLNANESSDALKVLTAAGMRDSFRVVHPDEKPAFTFHRFDGMKAKGRLGKIDFVLCDDRWDVLGAEIVRDSFPLDAPPGDGRMPSDHFAVTASLALRDDVPGGDTGRR